MIRFIALCLALSLMLAALSPAEAQSNTEALTEEQVELRAREIGRSLRCVVCQNQSIEESDASLAEDMRRLVRARVRQGETNTEVIDFMQERYGDFVLLKPPVQGNTYVLWAAPFMILLFGIFWFLRQMKRKEPRPVAPLSEDEKACLDALSDGD